MAIFGIGFGKKEGKGQGEGGKKESTIGEIFRAEKGGEGKKEKEEREAAERKLARRKRLAFRHRLARLLKEEKEIYAAVFSGAAAAALLLANFFVFERVYGNFFFTIVNIATGFVLLVPPTIVHYYRYRDIRSVEERFPDFLRDVVEGLRGGMTLPLAMETASRNKYGALSKHVNAMVAQISVWGVPFEKALRNFAEASKSKVVARAVSTIIESHRSGGDIAEVLSSVGLATVEIDKIKRERASRIYAQMTTGYIIFFVFVGVMVGMTKFLIPALAVPSVPALGAAAGAAAAAPAPGPVDLGPIFRNLAIIQGAFAGLAIGKMAEGTLAAGWKHAVAMSLIGYTALSLSGGIPAGGFVA